MDKKYKTLGLLHQKLVSDFVNGQFQIMNLFEEVWRGQIISWGIEEQHLVIYFEWYVRVCLTFDDSGIRRMVGVRSIPRQWSKYNFTLRMRNFYHPKSSYYPNGDPRRIKGLTQEGEEFRFFRRDDVTNLQLNADDNLVASCMINMERFSRGIPEPLGPPQTQ